MAMALRVRGFINCTVVGFRAEVSTHVGPRHGNGWYEGLRVLKTLRQLAMKECASLGDAAAVDDCMQTLLVPCDRCMLDLAAKNGKRVFVCVF